MNAKEEETPSSGARICRCGNRSRLRCRRRRPSLFFAAGVALLLLARSAAGWRPDAYPKYCTKDSDAMTIPPLQASLAVSFGGAVRVSDVEMVQVQAIIRHGARTPFEDYPCWRGYRESWDCDVTELMVPTPSRLSAAAAVLTGAGGAAAANAAADAMPPWLFRKLYDAFPKRNLLGGTCLVGQLIEEGFVQELRNGRHLRDAYVCSGPQCIFPTPRLQDIPADAIYLRSDDQQRVVMSGQLLTLGLFDAGGDTVLPWHTGDLSLDWMVPNPTYCPKLGGMLSDVKASDGWQELYYRGADMAAVNSSLKSAWGIAEVDWESALDCVMTSACTDRELPETMNQKLFDEIVVMSERYENYKHFWEGGKYAKTSMAPLVSQLRRHMQDALEERSNEKFVLFAGHDTTLQPLLAAIAPEWDGEWPAYASMMSIEIMRVRGQSQPHMRMVYNGKVMLLDGCSREVCPVANFVKATAWADNPEWGCGIPEGTAWGSGVLGTGDSGGDGGGDRNGIGGGSDGRTRSARYGGDGSSNGVDFDGDEPRVSFAAFTMLAVGCFAVGLVSGAAPTAYYYKRFRYERLFVGVSPPGGGRGRRASRSNSPALVPPPSLYRGNDGGGCGGGGGSGSGGGRGSAHGGVRSRDRDRESELV
ncbi:unnamed protein product [Phaeothamnion confervicola]